jgi:hypothetical protein
MDIEYRPAAETTAPDNGTGTESRSLLGQGPGCRVYCANPSELAWVKLDPACGRFLAGAVMQADNSSRSVRWFALSQMMRLLASLGTRRSNCGILEFLGFWMAESCLVLARSQPPSGKPRHGSVELCGGQMKITSNSISRQPTSGPVAKSMLRVA